LPTLSLVERELSGGSRTMALTMSNAGHTGGSGIQVGTSTVMRRNAGCPIVTTGGSTANLTKG
jgi:hypothetical protein